MSFSQGNISEEYARFRLRNSPLHQLLNSLPLNSPFLKDVANLVAAQRMPKLTSRNYRFIQNALSNIILYVQLENKQVSLEQICETIIDEARSIEAIGMQYIENVKRQTAQSEAQLETQVDEPEDPDLEEAEEEEEDESSEDIENPEEEESRKEEEKECHS
jgi:hypothetical protein